MKILLLITSICLLGCATPKKTGKTQAERLFEEATVLKKAGRFILATEKLNRIKTEHPYSFYAVPSELMLADILYEQENYVEASAAYTIFRDFHPKHEKIPYVIYKIAESYYKQIPETFDRDLESAFESMKYYREILRDYPKSEYAAKAKEKIAKAQQMIISKEQYIADFYYKTEVFDAAMWRYKDILANIKDIAVVRHSMVRLVQSSFFAGKYKECLHYANSFSKLVSGDKKELVLEFQDKCKKEL